MLAARLILILCGAFILGKGLMEIKRIDAAIIERTAFILIYTVGAVLLLGGIFLPLICRGFQLSLIVRILSILAGTLLNLLAVTGGIIAVYPLTVKRAKGTEAYILVLGASVIGEKSSYLIRSRGDKAANWLKRHPDSIAVLSGGKGGTKTEAETLRDRIMLAGVSAERLYCENKSTTTDENIQFSMPYLEADMERLGFEDHVEEHMAILSNHFHIFRLHYYVNRLGYPSMRYIVAPTPFNVCVLWYGREIMLTIRYWLTGL